MSAFINVLDSIYYNEFNPHAAQWLRNLMAAGLIAPGVVDERSIEDVTPDDLRGFTQCHFFAGIGVWSLALRSAGWPDDRPVWTGSAPCQPFSAAGAGSGFADERHLWPAFHHLIAERRPAIVLGEQVASSHVDPWIDLVHADLEAVGYAFGGIPFPSAGVGAPHIRDRLYWVAHSDNGGRIGRGQARDGRDAARFEPQRLRHVGGLANAVEGERGRRSNDGALLGNRTPAGRIEVPGNAQWSGGAGGLGDAERDGLRVGGRATANLLDQPGDRAVHASTLGSTGPTNGYWRAADWLGCRDGKWRPVEPGAFPLVNGPAIRVGRGGTDWRTATGEEGKGHRAGRLKGYGNAINAEAARIFVECVMGAI